ncbi:MAG: Na(+)-translocating NADH-quinone reductase subunit A [Gammaproteobacteria bacterium]|nr:Na(+)-translocating NADH-quinone reductase subunit A [Gammaproteobacteria bacterium]
MIKIKKGLNLAVPGVPEQTIEPSRPTRSVAVLGDDYPGMRPTMLVRVGDTVKRGQPLFEDKKNPGVLFTAPRAGTVASINRGAKRVLQSVVIDVQGDDAEPYQGLDAGVGGPDGIEAISREQVVKNLVASGLWTALRTRPYSKIPGIHGEPRSLFVTAIDTNPLAADPAVVIAESAAEFAAGLDVLAKLTAGPVYVCQQAGSTLPTGGNSRLSVQEFSGVHPAGLPGTHIHFLDPVGPGRSVWFIGYQDVIAVGHLFLAGELSAERVVALAGPGVERPRLVRTVLGADLDELTAGELKEGDQRVISGSIFSGRAALTPVGYLGRYHVQVSVLPEDRKRRLFGYLTPGLNKHSVFPIYLSRLLGGKNLEFTTTTNGSPRAMVPIGTFESVMPLDILPTQLLRSLLVGDLETAMNLGCLELDEDDIALCTYACPGKYEYGPVLRDVLTQIEKEG